MVSGDESCSRPHKPAIWKRSASDTCLDSSMSGGNKRRRDDSSSSDEDITSVASHNPPQMMVPVEADRRDMLQIALDQICELQRKLHGDLDSLQGTDAVTEEEEDEDTGSGSEEEDVDDGREVVLAGFEQCTKEALQYLIEQEGLGAEHPAVRALSQHLSARKTALDCRHLLSASLPYLDPRP